MLINSNQGMFRRNLKPALLLSIVTLSFLGLFFGVFAKVGIGSNKPNIISYVAKWDTVRVLRNPHKGWYHHHYDNSLHRYGIQDELGFSEFNGPFISPLCLEFSGARRRCVQLGDH